MQTAVKSFALFSYPSASFIKKSMADYKKLVPFVLKHEGGISDDPQDAGGFTNKGITLKTFRSIYGKDKTKEDLINITDEQWGHIFKAYYWDKLNADKIESQSIANMSVDWAYNAGVGTVAKKIQNIIGTKPDGIIGSGSLKLINTAQDTKELFNQIKAARIMFYKKLVEKKPANAKFLKGWLNRTEAIKFTD